MGVKLIGAVGENPPAKNEKQNVCKKPYESLRIKSALKYSEIDI